MEPSPEQEKLKDDWETLGTLDPLWAIYSKPQNQYGKWGVDEFFRTGEEHIAVLMKQAEMLGLPHVRERALDFGCGVGRLTRALAAHFKECVGVDISSAMVQRAREMNGALSNCSFTVNTAEQLQIFPDGHFDLIYTLWVLQHLPTRELMKGYVSELIRILKPSGLLVFQVRTKLRPAASLQIGRRVYRFLRVFGVTGKFLYERVHLSPMRVAAIPTDEMTDFLRSKNAKVLKVDRYELRSGSGAVFFVTK